MSSIESSNRLSNVDKLWTCEHFANPLIGVLLENQIALEFRVSPSSIARHY